MEDLTILCLVGGISRNSLNKKLFEAVKLRAPAGVSLMNYDISQIPFFSQDIEMEPPKKVLDFKILITRADAVLFITPEYNRSFPGVLKNAIDWGSRPYGQNLWDKKPTGVMGASPGNTGTFGAQHHLRQVCAYLNMPVMGQPEFYFKATNTFDAKGKLTNPKSAELIEQYWAAFIKWIELIANKSSPIGAQTFKTQGQDDSPRPH